MHHLIDTLLQAERTTRQFLNLVKVALDADEKLSDINPIQALMLFKLGDAKVTVGALTLSGCYNGTNSSYNIKKLVENGYVTRERAAGDARVYMIQLTERGRWVRAVVEGVLARYQANADEPALAEIDTTFLALRRLEFRLQRGYPVAAIAA
jgi:DNA-binding MarR family transcriptional regulator